jgi:hypothetical protein
MAPLGKKRVDAFEHGVNAHFVSSRVVGGDCVHVANAACEQAITQPRKKTPPPRPALFEQVQHETPML